MHLYIPLFIFNHMIRTNHAIAGPKTFFFLSGHHKWTIYSQQVPWHSLEFMSAYSIFRWYQWSSFWLWWCNLSPKHCMWAILYGKLETWRTESKSRRRIHFGFKTLSLLLSISTIPFHYGNNVRIEFFFFYLIPNFKLLTLLNWICHHKHYSSLPAAQNSFLCEILYI